MSSSNPGQPPDSDTIVVECGRLIDGTGAAPRESVSLVVEGGLVRRVVPTAEWRAENEGKRARVVDATGATVLPGLMDLHVHLASIVDPDEPNVILALMGANSPLATLHAAKNARLMIEAGFTTVRDVAGYVNYAGAEIVALRRAVEIGLVPGPRIFASGWVGQTAGHCDMGRPPTWPRPAGMSADGPWEVRRLVREFVRNGVDLIKTSAGGGAGRYEERWWRNYTYEELEAVCDEAHAYGKKVAVHVHPAEGIKRALRAGADTIEHGSGLDDEAIELFLQKGAFYVPTISVFSARAQAARARGGVPHPDITRKNAELLAAGFQRVVRAQRAGVKIACGTDTYTVLRHHWGENAYELEMLVEAGLSPMEAIVAATRISAEALGQQDRLGTLEPGKLADLLVFDGDPLADIRLLQERERIRLVVKGGEIAVDRRDRGRVES